jgi:hypothetical protein
MADVMDALVDEVLKSIQTRLASLEADVAALRDELSEVRREMEAAHTGQPDIRPPPAGIERRVERIERRLNAVDVAIK